MAWFFKGSSAKPEAEKKDRAEETSAVPASTEESPTELDAAREEFSVAKSLKGFADAAGLVRFAPTANGGGAVEEEQEEEQQEVEGGEEKAFLPPHGPTSYNFSSSRSGTPYDYPSVYAEADEMTNLSGLIYTLVELRTSAKAGKLEDPDKSARLLELPLPMLSALQILKDESEVLRNILSDGTHESSLSALTGTLDRYDAVLKMRRDADTASSLSPAGNGGLFFSLPALFEKLSSSSESAVQQVTTNDLTCPTLVAVGDDKPEEELVYVVGINPAGRRITVGFRGSATMTDFATDARMALLRVADPRAAGETKTKPGELIKGGGGGVKDSIGIHQGFHEYLFGGRENKYEKIMSIVNDLLDVDDRRKTFQLYVTGHSLGGALATLFGFYAAASSSSSSTPLPVTVVSVASPRVGNEAFAKAFASLESTGDIRHLRVANHRDPITLGPTVSSKRAMTNAAKAFSPLGYLAMKMTGHEAGDDEFYVHTGMKMKLRPLPGGRKEEEKEEARSKDAAVGEGLSGAGRSAALCEFRYSGARFVRGGLTVAPDDDDDQKGRMGSSIKDLPLASYHYVNTYTERLVNVTKELEGLTLNDLYRDHTSA